MTTWTTTTHWPPDLLHVADLTAAGLVELLGLAARMKAEPDGWIDAFAGASLACFSQTPSTPAGLSLEAAAHRLGMLPISVRPGELGTGGAEPLRDTARILSSYAWAVAVRDVGGVALAKFARAATVPVINAVSPDHDPCQAVADLLTLRERHANLDGVTLAYVGVVGSAARSLMQAGAMAGMNIRVACPPEYRPLPEDLTAAEVLAELHGGAVTASEDPREAVTGADAVYTAPWPTPVDEADRRRIREQLGRYRVDTALVARAKESAVVMHCLPAHRGEEIESTVFDGRRSAVWHQAANRLPAEQAIIYALVTAAGSPRRDAT
jgi:ornithine carbamoyltransferase